MKALKTQESHCKIQIARLPNFRLPNCKVPNSQLPNRSFKKIRPSIVVDNIRCYKIKLETRLHSVVRESTTVAVFSSAPRGSSRYSILTMGSSIPLFMTSESRFQEEMIQACFVNKDEIRREKTTLGMKSGVPSTLCRSILP